MVLRSYTTKLVEHGAMCPVVVDQPVPKPITPGSDSYYQDRNKDFVERHPSLEPPEYYLQYGAKYANRFKKELRPQLSQQGQAWVDRTYYLLQLKIEQRRTLCPSEFDELERSPKKFRDFAFDTHSEAYIEGGLQHLVRLSEIAIVTGSPLPVAVGYFFSHTDIGKILRTPDLRDIFTWNGMVEIKETITALIFCWASGKQCSVGFGGGQPGANGASGSW